jgi:hypothetical protein
MRLAIVIISIIFSVSMLLQFDPILQDPSYHSFADQRDLLGISNFWNVVTNLPFMILGILGGVKSLPKKWTSDQMRFFWFWTVFFLGVALVSIGSAYYHWMPNSASLVWDRLPMTLAFMSFFAFIIAERVHEKTGLILLPVLLLLGIASVWYWNITEVAGAGDLRHYVLVQFLPMLEVPLICFLFPNKDRETKLLIYAFGWYALAKVFEHFDAVIFNLTDNQMGGHALKHLTAGAAIYSLYKYAYDFKRVLPEKI